MSDTNHKMDTAGLMILRDKDLFLNASEKTDSVWKVRPTGKMVLFNDQDQIAIMGNKVNDFFLLPGGGIKSEESILEGVKRECQEETGCEVEILNSLGFTEDFRSRDNKHCISFGYTAKVIRRGDPTLTESEIDIGAYVRWIPIFEAVEIFINQEIKVKNGEVKFYNTCFNIFRDSHFIQVAQKLLKS
jgi:ADP-ribose pyrophosphatase YjhB (NUDIX family)